ERLARGPRAEQGLCEGGRRALRLVLELLVDGELADEAQQLAHVGGRGRADQKAFFHARISANTSTSPARGRPACPRAEATTSGSPQRRKGLVAISSPMVEGRVGSPRSRLA